MARKDEWNHAKKVFKNGTTRQKAEYILDYYKWHILFLMVILLLIGNIIYTNLTHKEYILKGIFLSTPADTETVLDLEKDFLKIYPIDNSSEDIFFDSSIYYRPDAGNIDSTLSYQAVQVLTTRIATGEIDFIVADDVTLTDLCYQQYFSDLSEVLSEDQMRKYEPYFLYYDRAVMEQINRADLMTEDADSMILPDPWKPEQMKDPIPVMINVTESAKISLLYPDSSETYAFVFLENANNPKKAIEVLEYLMR